MVRFIICSNCDKKKSHHAKGLCPTCYGQQYKPRLIICTDCGQARSHCAKGLCETCYQRIYRRQWRQENAEWDKAYAIQYYQKNQGRAIVRSRLYYQEHKEEKAHWGRKYYEVHREKKAAYQQSWQRDNPDKVAAQGARRQARKKSTPNTLTAEQAEKLFVVGQAMYPDEDLHLDHIVPISKGGGTTKANMHVIPASLNQSKGDKLPEEVYKQLEL